MITWKSDYDRTKALDEFGRKFAEVMWRMLTKGERCAPARSQTDVLVA
jgi:hypothetical protein